ncbi:PREDICTED: uncharacterized protein LOC108561143 [Nicrophorus vespilloides]|uniref:Uncharacterized protein LOC108561143 n=1 Tax=Nicrophorus vespilloides TaxID=110193 RepID=A0ABM1MIP8_NICVS|nr:PREDICTED: uncharacterized protein LOC108561143 [Nicrophorus vespilloides]
MRVCWKVLCCFGLVFWSSMCCIENIFGSILRKNEFSSRLEDLEESSKPSYKAIYDSKFEVQQILLWSFFSFTLAICVCYLMNLIKHALSKRVPSADYEIIQPAIQHSTVLNVTSSASKSKIPVLVTLLESKKSKPVEDIEEVVEFVKPTILDAVKDFPVTMNLSKAETELKESLSNHAQQRCSKMKDEMVELQVNSWREHSALVRKVEHLSKEKRELMKQLSVANKENKYTKQQLDDILNDRALLIKRLESATKEIKMNTATKQMTLEKLEEAFMFSNQMKDKMSVISREKDHLENKLKKLESQYKIMVEKQGGDSNCRLTDVTDDVLEDFEKESVKEVDISQSERDIQKVQTKLLDLERSLEKMRLLSSGVVKIEAKDEEIHIERVESLESNLEAVARTSEVSTKADEDNQMYNTCMAVIEYKESVTDSCVSSNNDGNSSVSLASDHSLTDSNKLGMVSQSPAFQNFLLRILDHNKI